MFPFNLGTLQGRVLLTISILLICLVSVVFARTSRSSDTIDSSRQLVMLSGSLAASMIVAGLIGESSKFRPTAHKKNTDNTMTFREDRGKTRLVPILLAAKGKSKKKPALKQYSVAEVGKKNTPEELWIIVDGRVYDITNYVEKHPGGSLVMHAMAGKDCTDAFANYHQARIYENMLPSFLIGEVTDMPVYPHVEDFRAIRQELLQKGLFETNPQYYQKLYMWLASLFITSLYLSLYCPSTSAHMLGAVFLGFFWQQLAGIGHDLGHSSVSHNFYTDHFTASLFGCLFMGISCGWWKRSHNTHHVVCNSIEKDPDIQHLPVFAVNPKILDKPFWSTYHERMMSMDGIATFFVSYQHYIFWPLMLVARFNLYAQSWIMLFTKEYKMYNRSLEFCSLTAFATWVLSVALCQNTWTESVLWVLLSHAVAGLLHFQIIISHWAMGVYHGNAYNDESDEWYKMQLITTMDIECYEWMDFFHIGLQFQIEHHFFPTLPRHNLRYAKKRVMEVCKKHGIHYHSVTFCTAVMETAKTLEVTAAMARSGECGVPNILMDGLNAEG